MAANVSRLAMSVAPAESFPSEGPGAHEVPKASVSIPNRRRSDRGPGAVVRWRKGSVARRARALSGEEGGGRGA